MTLDENDYLTYQLYAASKTPRVRNSRLRGWVITTVAFLALAYLFFGAGNRPVGYYFLFLSALSLTLYPLYSRWRYKRHYRKYIQDAYKNRFGEACSVVLNHDTIVTKDRTGEATLNTAEIEVINEIKDYYFIKFKTGMSLILSKVKADDAGKLKNEIQSLVTTKGIPHTVELDWRWR